MSPFTALRAAQLIAWALGGVALPAQVAMAHPAAMTGPATLAQSRDDLAALRAGMADRRRDIARAAATGASLHGLLASLPDTAGPPPGRETTVAAAALPPVRYRPRGAPGVATTRARQLDRLFDLIARAEAGPAQYDAVHHRARILPPAPPTRLTLGEILDWIAATPGQPHAIGRYQFIPDTLRYLMRVEGVPPDTVFSPVVQDRLATRLVMDAGLADYLAGLIPPRAFMDKLAYVWAGLPLPDGRSAYEGIAGNKATISRAAYEARFLAIFPPPPLLIGLPPAPDGR